jgi:nicotinamidase-related amidase
MGAKRVKTGSMDHCKVVEAIIDAIEAGFAVVVWLQAMKVRSVGGVVKRFWQYSPKPACQWRRRQPRSGWIAAKRS